MDYFRKAKVVRLRNLSQGHDYLMAFNHDDNWLCLGSEKEVQDGQIILNGQEMTRQGDESLWFVEFVENSDSVLRLISCYGKYLTASYKRPRERMTGCLVIQSLHPDLYSEWQPMMERSHVKLCSRYGTFLCSSQVSPITHDLPTHDLPDHTIWDVEVVKRKEEGSATNIDDKASSATKRRHKTGEGSSVTESPSGDSGLIRDGDSVRYRHHFWELKRRLLDISRKEDILVRGGSGTTALIRDVCADVSAHFGTIAWISIPKNNDSALIHEEIFLQLSLEMVAISQKFGTKTSMLTDCGFSLQQKEGCLIVVDNLDDPRTWKKFEEILIIVKRCRVIFIAERGRDSSYSQIKEHDREFEPYELKDLSHLPQARYLENFLEKVFPPPSKGLYELIVSKCKRLPTAIVCVLRNQNEWTWCRSSDMMKDEWEVRIPSDNLYHEFDVILQVLKALETLCEPKDLSDDEGHDELEPIQHVSEILLNDNYPLCLLYLSIFPGNRPLSCKTVSRLWAAEGILPDLRKAERVFKFLLRRNCILPMEERSGVLSTFQVDRRVREIIVSLSHLCDPVIKTSQGSTEWPVWVTYLFVRGTISASNREKTFSSIFVLGVSSDGDKPTASETSLSAAPDTSLSAAPDTSLLDLNHSKVLDLTGVRFQTIPDVLFDLTTNVRYLNLRNSSIKAIPNSIGKLTHLEFLDAKQSLVTKLPPQVARLKKIRHILIYHHKRDPLMESYNLIGFKALCKVGGFEYLEELVSWKQTKEQ